MENPAHKEPGGMYEEWRSHLAGDLSNQQKLYAALGFIVAAFRDRLRDLADLAWKPADRVLGSRTLSNLFVSEHRLVQHQPA
jgi:hypothetical protein